MIGEVAFLGWIALFVSAGLMIRAWRGPADGVRAYRLVAATVLLAAAAAVVIAPPDFGGVVLISLGLSLGGSVGAVLVERTVDAKVPAGFALARAAGALGCLWLVGAVLCAPSSFGLGARNVFIWLLLATHFAAMVLSGSLLMALPIEFSQRLRALACRLLPGVAAKAVWGLALLTFVFAILWGGLATLCLSATLAALAFGLHFQLRLAAGAVSGSALLDGLSAACVGMLGFALGDAMLIATGGFAAAASLAISQRAGRRAI